MSASATPHPRAPSGGVDTKTLFVTAVASAIAAYACSKLWAPGTLVAAAFTPVVVAILKDVVSRSTDVVTRAVPVRGIVRNAPPEPLDEPAATAVQPPQQDRVAQAGEIPDGSGGRHSRGLRVAIVTGLLGFVVAAVVLTVPELVAGGSASGGGRGTTFFGGGTDPERDTKTDTAPSEESAPSQNRQTTVTVPAPETTTTTTTPPPTTTDALPPTGGEAAPPPDPSLPVEPTPEDVPTVVAPPS